MGGIINVSYPKLRALSIDSSVEHIKTINLMIRWYLYRSSVFTQKWLPWQPGVKSEMALLLKMFCWGQSICLPTFMLVAQSERFQLILTLATGLYSAVKVLFYSTRSQFWQALKVAPGMWSWRTTHHLKALWLLFTVFALKQYFRP